MLQKAFFANVSQEKIIAEMREEGFSPKMIADKPGFIYKPHKHPETKYLVCLEGSMKVMVKEKTYDFEPADKLLILGNIKHSGIVGKNGCIYLWSEKIVS